MSAIARDAFAVTKAHIEAAKQRTDVYSQYVVLKTSGSWKVGRCPMHPDHNPSFAVGESGHWICYSGCGHGDVIDFIQRIRGVSFGEAVRQLAGDGRGVPVSSRPGERDRVAGASRSRPPDPSIASKVRTLWEGAMEPGIALTYLRSRGLKPTLPVALRGHSGVLYAQEAGDDTPALDEPWKSWWSDRTRSWWQGIVKPCTIAAITDDHGNVSAIQRIWCERQWEIDGGQAPAKGTQAMLSVTKKTLGPMSTGAVKLFEAGSVLGLAEGVETAIAAAEIFSVPVWATCSATRLDRIQLPDCVEQVIIFGDNDKPGKLAASRAEKALHARGYQADIAIPEEYEDWNRVLMEREGLFS